MLTNAFFSILTCSLALYHIIDAKTDHILVKKSVDDGSLAHPVMDIRATLTLSRNEILADNFTANCADNSQKQ